MYDVSITEESLFTKVIIEGEWSNSEIHKIYATKVWVEVANYCSDNNTKKLLIVSKRHGELSQISSYEVTMSLEYFGFRKDIKISYVDLNKQSFIVNSFSANQINKTGYETEAFDNEKDAIAWLIQ